MKMEIQVDVHAVYPSAAPATAKPGLPGAPCGSWCTPDITPVHTPIKHANPNIETLFRDGLDQKKRKTLDSGKTVVRLFTPTPPHEYGTDFDIVKGDTELESFKDSDAKDDPPNSPVPEKKLPAAEEPQSPVPSSPSRSKKWKGFLKLPDFCYPLAPIDPQGCVYITWLVLVTFCYTYNSWCIVLRASFPYQTPENLYKWLIADYFCDLIYLLDVALVKPRLMYLHEGFWVDDPVETRKNYRKKMQYKFDVISLMPLDFLYFYFSTDMVILRLPRMLKLQTFWELTLCLDRVLSSPYVVRVGKTLFYIFYLIHVNACAYYLMSLREGLGSNDFVYDGKGNAYLRCFYFATKTATSIGKNPKPEKTEEYLFMTVAWLMGVFVFALLIGQIRDIIATATRARTEYRKTVDSCTRYLRQLNMPASLQKRVTCWFKYTWSQQRCFVESNILDVLPYNMKCDVALEVHMSTLSKVQLFRDCSASLLRDLVLQLRPVSFLPGDVVVRRGDVGREMYIVKCGECYVMSQDETEVLATLGEGSVFGEISLLGLEGLRRRTATVRARGYASLFALTRAALDAALQQHRQAALVLRRRADQLVRENAERQAQRRIASRQARKAAAAAASPLGAEALRKRRSSGLSGSSAGSGVDRIGPDKTGADRLGTDKTSAERLGTDNSGSDRIGPDRAGERRARAQSATSRRKLSVISENKPFEDTPSDKEEPAGPLPLLTRFHGPLPKIVFSSE